MSVAYETTGQSSSRARVRDAPARTAVVIPFPARPGTTNLTTRQVRAWPARRRERVIAGAHPPAAGVRLTVRARRLITAVVAAAVLIALALGARSLVRSVEAPVIPRSAPSVVVVRPGDTLWSIARSLAPGRDVRAVVAALRTHDHLRSSVIRPGQRLVVPK